MDFNILQINFKPRMNPMKGRSELELRFRTKEFNTNWTNQIVPRLNKSSWTIIKYGSEKNRFLHVWNFTRFSHKSFEFCFCYFISTALFCSNLFDWLFNFTQLQCLSQFFAFWHLYSFHSFSEIPINELKLTRIKFDRTSLCLAAIRKTMKAARFL